VQPLPQFKVEVDELTDPSPEALGDMENMN